MTCLSARHISRDVLTLQGLTVRTLHVSPFSFLPTRLLYPLVQSLLPPIYGLHVPVDSV